MDAAEQKVHDDIAAYGWHAVNVFEDEVGPGFQYSIGFYRSFSHPEVLILGQRSNVMHGMLTRIATGLREGRRYDTGRAADDILDGYLCMFRPIPGDAVPFYLGWATWYYGEESFPSLQCIWPDTSGQYPWDPEASAELKRREPILHRGKLTLRARGL
jgi:hypothetical protein